MAGSGIYRATVVSVGSYTISLKIPRLTFEYIYTDVPFYGNKPSVNDEIIVGFLHGQSGSPVAIIPGGASAPSSSAQGDIDGVTAGLGLSGGGTSGTVSLAFAPSELSSVTVATDDKVVIADTSDSDNPKHVTAQSIANLASASPGGSDHQVQFNDNSSFGGDANFTYDGSAVGLGATLTVGVNGTGHDVQFYGDSTDHWMLWDQSADELVLTSDSKLSFHDAAGGENIVASADGHLEVNAGTTLDLTAPTIDLNASTAVTVDGKIVFPATAPSDANINIEFAEGYKVYSDNTGAGSDNSRLWFEAPDTGEIVLGPRTNAHKLHNLRLRSTTISAEGVLDITDTTDASDASGDTGALRTEGGASIAKKLYVNSHTFLTDHVQTGQASFVVEPWSSSTIALGNFGSVGTQGSYRTSLAWNYERGADGNFHHLDVNSYPQAGDFSIGNSGFLFNYDTDYESAHTTNPTAVASVNTDGQIHAIKGGADGGIVLGQTFSTGYVGLRTANMSSTGSEYIIMSAGGHTLISAGTGGAVYIRANANDSDNELLIGNGTLNIDFDDYVVWETPLPVVSGYSTLRRKNSNNIVGYDGSSIRYKENVTNFVKSDWEKIYNLQAVRFNWKKEIDEDQNRSWGFISEDVYAEIPELGVMRVVEGVNDGNPVPDTVNYEQMCVFLVEAVKDLNTRLAALE